MKYDYAVIGAGVSGMSAAVILAQKGYRTALIEQSGTTGPTIRGFTRQGVFFDTGFHYTGAFSEREPLDRLFHYLGMAGKLRKILLDGEGVDLFRCLDPPFEFSFPCGLENIGTRLTEAFPAEEKAVHAYLRIVWNAYQRLPYINLNREMPSFQLPYGIREQSLAEVLNGLTANTMLKSVLSMHCLLHGVPPSEVPITNHACVAAPYYESAHGIEGGGRRLAEAFDERLQETGVDVYCGSRAEKILVSNGQHLAGIQFEQGNILECQGVIVTVHPTSLLEMAPDSTFRPAYRTNLRTLEDTSSALILFGICREPLKRFHHTNVFAFPSTEAAFNPAGGIIQGRPIYITGTKIENLHKGRSRFIAICPAPNLKNGDGFEYQTDRRANDYDHLKEGLTTRLRAYIEDVIPELQGNMTYAESATPRTLVKYTNNPTGSLYGVKHKIGQLNPIPLTRIKNLYIAGQGVTAPGILGAMISALLACGYIVGHETLRKELKQCI